MPPPKMLRSRSDYSIHMGLDGRAHPSNTAGDATNDKSMSTDQVLQVLSMLEKSEMFTQFLKLVKSWTGDYLDLKTLVSAGATLTMAGKAFPSFQAMVYEQMKSAGYSSLTISRNDDLLREGLLQMARTTPAKSWYKFTGQHEMSIPDGQVDNLPGVERMFKYQGKTFIIEYQQPSAVQVSPYAEDSLMVVRCFGPSNQPVRGLFAYVRQEMLKSNKLCIKKICANAADKTTERNKRPLSSIDLEPAMKADITRDAETFFGESSQAHYENISMPWRKGYLLHSAPGCGKSSLSVALASHFNVPLVIIILKGMDDVDFMGAFSRLPPRCVVLLEDIDCAGAEVENRDASKPDAQDQASRASGSESTLDQIIQPLIDQQKETERKILRELKTSNEALFQRLGGRHMPPGTPHSTEVNTDKQVTLSGLLNVIDGADAAEGRLLIMTTNCPEKLDEALIRPGRCDRKFHLGYASKVTSRMTFMRIFGLDMASKYSIAYIERLADAFAAQFPARSKISTADLSMHFNLHRGRPCEAVENFADWCKLEGDDKFGYRAEAVVPDTVEDGINIPEPFDRSLLQVTPDDLADAEAIETLPVAASNSHCFGHGSSAEIADKQREDLLNEVYESSKRIPDVFIESLPGSADRQTQVIAFFQNLGEVVTKVQKTSRSDVGRSLDHVEFTDSDFEGSDFDEWHDAHNDASTSSDRESHTEPGHVQPSAVPSRVSVRFAEDDNLRTISPRHIDE
jgi:chaperone BCS1